MIGGIFRGISAPALEQKSMFSSSYGKNVVDAGTTETWDPFSFRPPRGPRNGGDGAGLFYVC